MSKADIKQNAEAANPYAPVDEEVVGDWLAMQDVSEKTKSAYRVGFKTFCAFVRESGLDFDCLNQLNIIDFKLYLQLERGLSPSTVNTYLAGVKSFYHYAEQMGDLKDAARNVKGVAQKRGFKREALSVSQVHRMLSMINTDDEAGLRNYAILNLMVRCGLRDIEVVRANVGDIQEKAGVNVLMVHGKARSGKDEYMVLTPEALKPIREYLAVRPNVEPKDPLFTSLSHNNEGGRLTTRAVSQIAKKAMERADIVGKQYSAHSLRHTAVTLAFLGGATEREAQQMARHANISTTMIYSHDLDRIKSAAEWKVSRALD